jgi:hypothetical protein
VPLAPGTVNRKCALVLRKAVAWDELDKMPGVRDEPQDGRERSSSDDEVARLLAVRAIDEHNAAVVVAIRTGLCKAEPLALEYGQVHFARG